MSAIEFVCVFVRATGDRLRAAERLVLALPQLVDGAPSEVELRYQAQACLLGVFVRLWGDGLGRARDRLVFWTARAGGRALAADQMTASDRARIATYLDNPSQALPPLAPGDLFEASGRFFTGLGAPAERRRSAAERPVLVMDVGGPGWEGVRWSAARERLFVAAPLAPPAGDEVPLLLRIPGATRPIQARARIIEVRERAAAGPGAPAGYTLQLETPPAQLLEALAGAAPEAQGDTRAAPRFHVSAPVKVMKGAELQLEDEPGPAPAKPPASHPAANPPATRALIEYATEQELAADYLENLSQGGAYVRTGSPAPVGAPVELQLRLPNGAELRARATVAFVREGGMGVRFTLDPEADAQLAAAMAHISARPRRALVVDDDETVRRIVADALRERGFEVLIASNATEGLSLLSEELLALDLLVTDVVMPGMDGEELVRRIRRSGGEVDLAIVCVTGQPGGAGVEARLEQVGADAVLDKALGPELIAQAADAVLERKRLVSQ